MLEISSYHVAYEYYKTKDNINQKIKFNMFSSIYCLIVLYTLEAYSGGGYGGSAPPPGSVKTMNSVR